MRFPRVIWLLLALAFGLACSLSAPPGSWANPYPTVQTVLPDRELVQQTALHGDPTATLTPTPPPTAIPDHVTGEPGSDGLPQSAIPTQTVAICKVKTGLDNGRLNLRSCPSVDCAAIAWLEEGQSLTILSTPSGRAWQVPPAGDWLPVQF